MKLPIHRKKRPTGPRTSPSHWKKSRSHCGGWGGGGAGRRLNWIDVSAFSASCAAANPSAAPAACCPCCAIGFLPHAPRGATIRELDEALARATAKCGWTAGRPTAICDVGEYPATAAADQVNRASRSANLHLAFGRIGSNPVLRWDRLLSWPCPPSSGSMRGVVGVHAVEFWARATSAVAIFRRGRILLSMITHARCPAYRGLRRRTHASLGESRCPA